MSKQVFVFRHYFKILCLHYFCVSKILIKPYHLNFALKIIKIILLDPFALLFLLSLAMLIIALFGRSRVFVTRLHKNIGTVFIIFISKLFLFIVALGLITDLIKVRMLLKIFRLTLAGSATQTIF